MSLYSQEGSYIQIYNYTNVYRDLMIRGHASGQIEAIKILNVKKADIPFKVHADF